MNQESINTTESLILPLRLILPITSFGVFMAVLDGSILNVSLYTIQTSLGVDKDAIRWIVIIYLLVMSSAIGLTGSLGDSYGRKKLFMSGISLFTLGSLFCALSNNLEFLFLSRIIQSLGGSALLSNGLALVMTYALPKHRGRAIGINSFVVASGLTAGPILGGIITTFIGWQAIFLLNLPIGILGFFLTFKYIPETPLKLNSKFDILGTVYFALITFSIVAGIIILFEGNFWAAILLGFGISLIVPFFLHESNHTNPIISIQLIRNRKIAVGLLSAFLSYMAINGAFFLMPFFYQEVLLFDPAGAGLLMIVSPLIMSLSGPITGIFAEKIDAIKLATFGIFAQTLFLVLLSFINQDMSLPIILTLIAFASGSLAIFTNSNGTSVMNATPKEYLSITSGLLNLSRTVAFSLATGLSVSIFNIFYLNSNPTDLKSGPIFESAYYNGLAATLVIFAIIALLGGIVSILRGKESKY